MLALAIVSASPLAAPALGQSAGDDQYADPLVPDGGTRDPAPSPPRQDGAGTPPAAPRASPPTGSTAPPTPVGPADVEASPRAATLPRTGADAGVIAAFGLALTASGLLLRVRIARRAHR
jgi:LPXTG-motif cell wall-anchored protein